MEPAPSGQALSPASGSARGGRRLAALLSFGALGLAWGCGGRGPAVPAESWRIGLGARAMALSPGGGLLAVACARSNDVWLLSLPDGAKVARVDTAPRPRAVYFAPGGRRGFYVAAGLTGVALVASNGSGLLDDFSPPLPIRAFSADPGSGNLLCALAGLPLLGVFRGSDLHLDSVLAVGGEVQAVGLLGGDAWVATRRAGGLVKVSVKRMSVVAQALAGPDPDGLALDRRAGLAYVPCFGGQPAGDLPRPPFDLADLSPTALLETDDLLDAPVDPVPAGGGVAVLRLRDTRRVDYLPVPGGPLGAALSPSGRELAVDCADGVLRVLDLRARAVRAGLPLGGRPGAMLALPGGRLAVALQDRKAVVVVDPGGAWN